MSGNEQIPDPLDATVADRAPGMARPPALPPLPSSLPPLPPALPLVQPPTDATIIDPAGQSRAGVDEFVTMPATRNVGSFTTSLAAATSNRIPVSIPQPFLAAGSTGTTLHLVPVEQLRGKPPTEIFLKTGPTFLLGRSPEADWITCFFPRNEKNDMRSKRLSKIHARIEMREGQLWVHRMSGTTAVHIGQREVANDPSGANLREHDHLILAEDYALEVLYDISLKGTLRLINGDSWQKGRMEFSPHLLGAVRFEPLNSALAIRNSCWLFVDVGFGSARGGILTAGAELAPQQGVFMTIGGCFWILNLMNNEKISVNEYRPAAQEIVPLTHGDSVWLGAVRYRAEIA